MFRWSLSPRPFSASGTHSRSIRTSRMLLGHDAPVPNRHGDLHWHGRMLSRVSHRAPVRRQIAPEDLLRPMLKRQIEASMSGDLPEPSVSSSVRNPVFGTVFGIIACEFSPLFDWTRCPTLQIGAQGQACSEYPLVLVSSRCANRVDMLHSVHRRHRVHGLVQGERLAKGQELSQPHSIFLLTIPLVDRTSLRGRL